MGISVDTEFDRDRLAWWAVILALGAVLAFVVYAFLGVFLLGVFVYYATRPVYRRLLGRVGSPTLVALGSLVAVALPVLVLVSYTVVVGVEQLSDALSAGPDFASYLAPYLDVAALRGSDPRALLDALPERLSDLDAGSVRGVLSTVVGYLGAVLTALLYLFVVLALAFFLLRDDRKLARWYRSMVGEDSVSYAFATAVDRDLQTLYFGNILTAFAIAAVAAVTYNALDAAAPAATGVPAPILLGLLTGVGSLVPVVGPKLVYVPVALYMGAEAALTDPGLLWFPVVFTVAAFVVVDTLPELLLRPYISGRSLHVGMVMFAYILGPVLFGWYGLFLAPLLLVLIVQSANLVLPNLVRRERLTPRPLRDDAVNPGTTPDATRPAGESAVADDSGPAIEDGVADSDEDRPSDGDGGDDSDGDGDEDSRD